MNVYENLRREVEWVYKISLYKQNQTFYSSSALFNECLLDSPVHKYCAN